MLSDGTAPSVLGFTPPLANLGEMRSWGWEITLNWNDQIGDNFRYNVGLNLMYNQNRVVERKEAPQNEEYMYQKDVVLVHAANINSLNIIIRKQPLLITKKYMVRICQNN